LTYFKDTRLFSTLVSILSLFVTQKWECVIYWYIFGFCRLLLGLVFVLTGLRLVFACLCFVLGLVFVLTGLRLVFACLCLF
uniref:Uncharacterized protein n=1 Tax=Leptobrachium leishanense TaxID=445787 RepID=A0A8C5MBS5_9ANUR